MSKPSAREVYLEDALERALTVMGEVSRGLRHLAALLSFPGMEVAHMLTTDLEKHLTKHISKLMDDTQPLASQPPKN